MKSDQEASGSHQLPSITFNDAGVDRIVFALPPTERPDLSSVTVFALHKAGSVLLNKIVQDLCDHVGVTYVSLPSHCFRIGLPIQELPSTTSQIFLDRGYCYGGFRLWPRNFEIPFVSESKPILLVRDPRDRLVSHYFSLRESHPEPGREMKGVRHTLANRPKARSLSLDEFAMQVAPDFLEELRVYREALCETCYTRVYRYEDVIYRKLAWVRSLVRHFGWEVPDDVCSTISAKHDRIPAQEDASRHIRQVHPGNFRKHLSSQTIDQLNDLFGPEMRFFGYDLR